MSNVQGPTSLTHTTASKEPTMVRNAKTPRQRASAGDDSPPVRIPKLARDPMTDTTFPEECFCVEIIKTGNLTEAYRRTFPEKAIKIRPHLVGQYAQTLANQPRMQARLAAMRDQARETLGISLQEHLASLKDLREGARLAVQFGPAVAAEVNRGKVSGLYVDKVEHSGVVNIVASTFDEGL